jgi:ATP adenylyltransferase
MTNAPVEPLIGLAGDPDGFDRLWVPQRMVYVDGPSRPKGQAAEECPFCEAPGRSDEDGLIVARGKTAYVLLNLFPYNPGHLLVCPYRHIADLTDLDVNEANELVMLTRQAMTALTVSKKPHGFNLGMNQGAAAGAGIAGHLHQHVVPRWSGDSNFFPIVAQTRALPELLSATRSVLAQAWPGGAGN